MDIDLLREEARLAGVLREENLPYLLQPSSPGGAGVLLVHGFSATPREMRPAAEALRDAGFTALAVRLPGHGTTPEDLEQTTRDEWRQAVVQGLDLLKGCRRVYGLGLSTGALLLLTLTARSPLSGLALLSPFLRLRHPLAKAAGLLRHIHRWHQIPLSADLSPYYYSRRPLSAIREVVKLAREVEGGLAQVSTPTLVIGGAGDRTADLPSQLSLFRSLGSPRKEYHLFGPEVPHILTGEMNPRRTRTVTLCRDFFLSLEPSPPSSGCERAVPPPHGISPERPSCR